MPGRLGRWLCGEEARPGDAVASRGREGVTRLRGCKGAGSMGHGGVSRGRCVTTGKCAGKAYLLPPPPAQVAVVAASEAILEGRITAGAALPPVMTRRVSRLAVEQLGLACAAGGAARGPGSAGRGLSRGPPDSIHAQTGGRARPGAGCTQPPPCTSKALDWLRLGEVRWCAWFSRSSGGRDLHPSDFWRGEIGRRQGGPFGILVL